MKNQWLFVLWCVMFTAMNPVFAGDDGVIQLKSFLKQTRAAEGQFKQVQTHLKTGKQQRIEGVFRFMRPGRFVWQYQKPYEQLIQSDGKTLWLYDKDLQQVTRKPVDTSLGVTPAAILFGQDLFKYFKVAPVKPPLPGSDMAVNWVQLLPLTKDSNYQKIYVGLSRQLIRQMLMVDNFGNQLVIDFNEIRSNPKLVGESFDFTPPKGVEVIGG